MQFFWVNLGTTHREAKEKRFLWAPAYSISKKGKKSYRVHWDNVNKVKSGDLIFCCFEQKIRFIAQAKNDAYVADRPPSRNFQAWADTGYRVDIEITDLDNPVHRDTLSADFVELYNQDTEPTLFDRNKELTQIYMAKLQPNAGLYLLEATESLSKLENQILESSSTEKKISKTTREALVQARVGQGLFRSNLLKRWNHQCALTGLSNPIFLVASHIEAWSIANNHARLDTENGLLLATHIDRLFDRGMISFGDDGRLLIGESLSKKDREIFGLNTLDRIHSLTSANRQYLAKHRALFKFI